MLTGKSACVIKTIIVSLFAYKSKFNVFISDQWVSIEVDCLSISTKILSLTFMIIHVCSSFSAFQQDCDSLHLTQLVVVGPLIVWNCKVISYIISLIDQNYTIVRVYHTCASNNMNFNFLDDYWATILILVPHKYVDFIFLVCANTHYRGGCACRLFASREVPRLKYFKTHYLCTPLQLLN